MKYRDFLVYSRAIRYVVFFLTLIMMIFTVKVYLNDFNIEESIAQEASNKNQIESQDNFEKKFYVRYLQAKQDSQFFIAHDNLYADEHNGEYIIKFSQNKPVEISQETGDVATQEAVFDITNPKDSWDYYLTQKMNKFKSLF